LSTPYSGQRDRSRYTVKRKNQSVQGTPEQAINRTNKRDKMEHGSARDFADYLSTKATIPGKLQARIEKYKNRKVKANQTQKKSTRY
jgi:hypothetical protein